MKRSSVPYFRQKKDHWCGPASVQMVLAALGMRRTQQSLARILQPTRAFGTTRNRIATPLRMAGLAPVVRRNASYGSVRKSLKAGMLVIVNFLDDDGGHFSVVTGIDSGGITFNDPWHGKGFRFPRAEFLRRWSDRSRWLIRIKPQ